MLLLGEERLTMSEIGRIEVANANASMAARRTDRIPDGIELLARFEADCRAGGRPPTSLMRVRQSGSASASTANRRSAAA